MCEELIANKEIKELWQGIKTTYYNKYFAIQTQSKNLKQTEEIIELLTSKNAKN